VKNRFPDNYTVTDTGYDLLKTAVIVGENAGGKSNFINSLKFLKSLFDTNTHLQSVNAYLNSRSLLETKEPKQKFEIIFEAGNKTIYGFEIELDERGIFREKLVKKSKRKSVEQVIYDIVRSTEGRYEAGTGKAKEMTTVLKNSNNSSGLFVSKIALLGNEDAIATVEWVMNILYPGSIPADQEFDALKKEADIKIIKDARYLEIFRMVDYSICGIEVDEEKPYSKTLVMRKDAEGNLLQRELSQDSTGVREFFAWAVQIFRVVYENKVVFADEMDRVLNPILSDRVVAYCNGMEHTGQFIFSTHNVLHLNLKNYMKEQIYFVTKSRNNLTSELYSLADFPDVRYETAKIYEFYMKGILGGTAFE
jgi:hypothetical protein